MRIVDILNQMHSRFRCPYEILGYKKKTIIRVNWGHDRTERFETGKKALQLFYTNTNLTGLIIDLPDDPALTRCKTIEDLAQATLAYATELLAIQTDVRFAPLLKYQQSSSVGNQPLFKRSSYDAMVAASITAAIRFDGYKVNSIADLAEYYHALIKRLYPEGYHYNLGSILIRGIITLSPWIIEVMSEQILDPCDPFENKNLFIIIRGPLYPKKTGRYSKKFQVTLTRHSDFEKVHPEEALLIRKRNNESIAAAGFVVNDLEKDQQNPGIWIPIKM